MAHFIITYDVRATHHDYAHLYEQLKTWGAAHLLQNSVWLADLTGTAAQIRDIMVGHMHPDDAVSVIQLPDSGANWATMNCRPDGANWLKARFP